MKRYRLSISGIIALLLLSAFSAPAFSSNAEPVRPMIGVDGSSEVGLYLAEMQSEGRAYLQSPQAVEKPPSLDMREPVPDSDKFVKPKSPLKAFVYSAVLPGAGQLYTGSKLKAAIFLGLEALTWTGQIIYTGKGDDKTDEFNNFADTHWSEGRYGDFLERNWDVRDDDSVLDLLGNPRFTHHLPDTKTQQYYEMIGKYDQFVFGWDDIDTVATPPDSDNFTVAYSANRMDYEDMRHKANQMYDRATAALIATMTNHLISGIEAALAAKSHNKKVKPMAEKLSFRAVTARIDDNYFPMMTMTYKF